MYNHKIMGHQQGKRNNQVMADPFEKLSKTCDQGKKMKYK